MNAGHRLPREVWIVSNFPPPVHGVSAFNAALRGRLDQLGVAYRIFRVGTHGALSEVEQFKTRKLVSDMSTVARLGIAGMSTRGRRSPVIYFTPSQGGLAVARDLAVTRLARSLHIPVVAHLHGCAWLNVWERGGWEARIMSTALRSCDVVVCLGSTYATRMNAATGLRCIGINVGAQPPSRMGVRSLPPSGGRLELLYFSNLIKAKGIFTAAEATRVLRARGVPARLRCAGNWKFEADRLEFIERFTDELASGVVELTGFVDDALKTRLFEAAHFFVLPTQYPPEGQPTALIEAFASGTVPITTQQGAIADLFGFPGWDTLANDQHRDPARVADTIVDLIASPERYRHFSEACLERYREALTFEACTDALLTVLQGTSA